MNLARYLDDSAERYPDKIAVRFEGKEITFSELKKRCNRLALGLTEMGLKPGDICVLMMPNSLDFYIAYYGLAKTGASVVPVNFLYKTRELEHIFNDARPKAFIGREPYLDEVRKVLGKAATPEIRLAMDLKGGDSDFTPFEKAFSSSNDFETYPSKDNDTWAILYTSGTTGAPKGVMLTHGNLAQNSKIVADMRGETSPDTLVIGVLPFYHVYGQTSAYNASMYLGITVELFPQFDPDRVIRIVEEETRPTMCFAVPTMINRLIQVASQRPLKRSSLRFCISGGASLPVELLHRFEALFHTKIYEGYGLTEAPVCVENPYGRPTRPGSIGFPIKGFSARIVDDLGVDVKQGDSGELLIKGPGVMKGYLNRPKETAETITDGWLHTGDIARTDKDGYIYIVDRKKDLIIRGGYNVYPREIEEVLYQIPQILETAVFGVPHPDLGEEVAAVVVLKDGETLEPDTVRSFVKSQVAPYKYPRIIKIVKELLPKSATGKILKREIRKIYSEGI
ncbi:MAG: long-chain fatty acid--CoA ligase [Desulfobacteraceae bacterium]|jgi:long-chain acyl-CoA synthetase|nr:MAG: long-chain fatty acid--CoA ligase [Desulfobacteraceae bacterium]